MSDDQEFPSPPAPARGGFAAPPAATAEGHLSDYIEVLARRRWIALGCLGLSVLGAIAYNRTLLPVYSASAKLMVDEQVQSEASPRGDESRSITAKKAQLAASIPVAEAVYRALTHTDKEDADLEKRARDLGEDAPLKASDLIDKRMEGQIQDADYLSRVLAVQHRVWATPLGTSTILVLTAEGGDPQEVAQFVNTYARVFERKSLELKTYEARKANRLLTLSLETAKDQLFRAEDKLRVFQETNDLPALEDKLTYLTSKTAINIEEDLRDTDAKIRESEARITLDSQAALAQHQEERSRTLRDAQRRLSALLRIYTPEHPSVVKAREELAALEEQEATGKRGSASREPGAADLHMLRLRREEICRRQGSYETEIKSLMEVKNQDSILRRGVQAAEKIYDLLLTRQKEAALKEATEVPDVWVMEPAVVPPMPIRPNKGRNLTMGLFLGLAAGLGLAFFLEYMDQTLKSREDIAAGLGLPVLGVILADPDLQAADRTLARVAQSDPHSPTTEAVKVLRTFVKYHAPKGKGRTLLLTSSGPGEGKTTIASNLAISLAQAGERVLLVDTDLRRPTVHRVFGIPNTVGFSDCLEKPLADLVQPSGTDGLTILTSGPEIHNPGELLFSPHVKEIVETAGREYDRVIFDSPPVNVVSDAAVLASLVESAIFVVRAGRVTLPIASQALENLAKVQVRPLGVVVNGMQRPSLASRYYGRYYGYYYGHYYRGPRHSGAPTRRKAA